MQNFTYYNPVKVVYGQGSLMQTGSHLPPSSRILVIAGKGSIKENGILDKVLGSLLPSQLVEIFWGIEANPDITTCLSAIQKAKEFGASYLLAVGGGSVFDATKLIAAALGTPEAKPWDLVTGGAAITGAVPWGGVLTLPATGSEWNCFSVISKRDQGQKRAFGSPLVYPKVSLLDPDVMLTLPPRQLGNGIVDAFTHVMEQYATKETSIPTPIQTELAESILRNLVETGPKLMKNPKDSGLRTQLMWSASMALNGLVGAGVVQDWATHSIGHELTALKGLDHAQTLAIVLPALMQVQFTNKKDRLARMAVKVWGIDSKLPADTLAKQAIDCTKKFFENVGVPTSLKAYEIGASEIPKIVKQLQDIKSFPMGQDQDIDAAAVQKILELALN